MLGVKKHRAEFEHHWRGRLADYVTILAWSPDGQRLAVASGAGEICLWQPQQKALLVLQTGDGGSIDCLAFSHDGQFLAAAGQRGTVQIWQMVSDSPQLITTLENSPHWIDQLFWSPTCNHLAFQLGFYVQIWDAESAAVVDTLDLEATAQDFQWHPNGQILVLASKNQLRLWNSASSEVQNYWETMAPSSAISWSVDGLYLAVGGIDRTLLVWEWGIEFPWQMQGFPGKIGQIVWPDPAMTGRDAPLFAVSCADGVVCWRKDRDENVGWQATPLTPHRQKVQAIAFQAQSLLLASAAGDGQVCLWHQAQKLSQKLTGATHGFFSLAWHPQGKQLAAGGQDGELYIWSQALRGKGFSR